MAALSFGELAVPLHSHDAPEAWSMEDWGWFRVILTSALIVAGVALLWRL